MNFTMIALLFFAAFLVFVIGVCVYRMIVYKDKQKERKQRIKKKGGSIWSQINDNDAIQSFGAIMPGKQESLETMFNRSKNPWGMTYATFQAVKYGGAAILLVAGIPLFFLVQKVGLIVLLCAFLCYWYPTYYYKAIGNEREEEWGKFYEFVWVLQNNLSLYDPAKAYLETRIYIEEHSPNNKELIQGFNDFYNHWNEDDIDPVIRRYYNFSITREITQIVFNMHKTGDFPEDSLKNLRRFIIQQQDLSVKKLLSSLAGKATIFSLPFMMISVILALMVPLLLQLADIL